MKKLLTMIFAGCMAVATAGAYADDMKKDNMSKEKTKKSAVKKDTMGKAKTKKDAMKKDTMGKDEMKK